MSKILGIDTGTNSLGWAIVEKTESNEYNLLEHGTQIFQEGVKIEKGIESSKAADRTAHRSLRKHYYRRKLRKIRLLTILSEYGLCPSLTKEELRAWREGKSYPQDEAFMIWQRTEDKCNINPYAYRYRCLTEKLDLNDASQRQIIGRALYHINQRRGFLSNRKETTKESEGKVKTGISELSKDIENAGCSYLGEYFYRLYQNGERIRTHYTSRNEHYFKEFKAICARQELPDELARKLETAIFFQRPLKSQKQQVGKCTFEPKKSRCPVSHPLYEEFRMYSFINNIKVQTPEDYDLRPLNAEEMQSILPLFHRKSKSFSFEDIAKKVSGGKKNTYCYYKEANEFPYRFNYHIDTTVSGCPVTAGLISIFGDDWLRAICEVYTLSDGKSELDILNDVWHALFFYDDEDKLSDFARSRLQLSEEEAKAFVKIPVPQEYAALSLKAICKILPYLKDYGLKYSEAVFLANLGEVIPSYLWREEISRRAIVEGVIDEMHKAESDRNITGLVKAYLKDRYAVSDKDLEKLYHPSMIETYPQQRPDEDGLYQLGSPRINSVRNPMAMRSLFRLRKVVNELLREGKIDKDTIIHIEFSRDLNDANKRKAIKDYQAENEKNRELCRKKIKELLDVDGTPRAPSDTDILKYQLWEEQRFQCLYTGEEIGLADFLCDNPKYDIEHTLPQSAGGDSTKMNLTLCKSKFNREVKRAQLPSQLAEHEEILFRIRHWKERYEELDKQIRKLRGSRATDKESKDRMICKRHRLTLERDYWKGKYERFTMTSVPEGFSRRQGTDISVISKYARLYLKSVFDKVFIVKGIATSDFRQLWRLQDEYTKKERVNHAHHCVDAITIACIGPYEYGQLAKYYHDLEANRWFGLERPKFRKPWPTFTEDIKAIQDDLIVAHHTQDNMPKTGRRRVLTSKGKVLTQGDAARGSLHLDTYYGAICKEGEVKYVIRKPLDSLDAKDIKNIVDGEVQRIVQEACAKYGDLKKAVQAGDVWMNREKGVKIGKVRVYATGVTRPVNIRRQRDLSQYEYKHQYHVMNDRNYMMAIYVGKNDKGKEKREFKIFSVLDAADYYKKSNGSREGMTLAPAYSESGYELTWQLKTGAMVLLYENTPEEIWECSKAELENRLYKVTGLSSMVVSGITYGRIYLLYHQEARASSNIKTQNGEYKQNEEHRASIMLLHTQFKALAEGRDFTISETGEIKFL